jgi:hypothetical protein
MIAYCSTGINKPKKLGEIFKGCLNTFFSIISPINIFKVINFAVYQQGVDEEWPWTDRMLIIKRYTQISYVNKQWIKFYLILITSGARKIIFTSPHY